MPVDVSQQLMPDVTAGQVLWQSASAVHPDTHAVPPLVELDDVLVDAEVVVVVVSVVVDEPPFPPFPPYPPNPPVPSVSLPDAQAANSAGATKARATKVMKECFTIGTRLRDCRMVYKRLPWAPRPA